jgi:hypothetical protein
MRLRDAVLTWSQEDVQDSTWHPPSEDCHGVDTMLQLAIYERVLVHKRLYARLQATEAGVSGHMTKLMIDATPCLGCNNERIV